jgi:hypothetical protein
MKNTLLLGVRRHMVPLPRPIWQGEVFRGAEGTNAKLGFMSKVHHRVRDFVVLELSRLGEPLSADYIADRLELPLDQIMAIVEELERNMTFLYRSRDDAVTWAYPVTVDPTPHHVTFSTGERVNAA